MLYSAILARVQAPLGAAAITLIAVLASALVSHLGVFRSTLSRAIETLVRRFPTPPPFVTLLAIFSPPRSLLAFNLDYGCRNVHILNALRYFLRRTDVTIGNDILSGDFLEQILARVSLDRSRIFFIGGCFCLTVASIAGLRSHDVQDELAKGYAIPSTILKVLQIPFDKDGDGYATIFGGGDCNDFDSLIHPQAVEIYGNDVDENCDGDIAMKQASERKTIAPVFQLPIYQSH